MRICLVRCPSPFLIDERMFPPLGLIAVGTGLKMHGHEVLIYDGDMESIPAGYDGYGFGPTAPEYPAAKKAQKAIWRHDPKARMVLGGPHATLNFKTCQYDGWHSIVCGDGEVIAEQAFLGSGPILVAYELSLDEYPIPDRSLLDIHRYNCRLGGKPTTTLVTSKGCPFACGFCCKNHGRVRLRSAERVIEEIKYLHNDLGYEALAFPEDIFILDKRRTEAVCKCLKELGIVWRCLVRADVLVRHGQDFVKTMKSSGCIGVGMGIESGSERILQGINKGETLATIRTAIDMLKQERIVVKGFFIVGLPGESTETIAETDAFLNDVQLDDIDCKIFQPYPGSPIYDHRTKYDINWNGTPLEHTFYKGRPGDYSGSLSTSRMTTEQIVEAWKMLEMKHKKW